MPWASSITVDGDAIIKVAENFEMGGSSSLTINGNVTIYADGFNIDSGSNLTINGSLKVVSNQAFHFVSPGTVNTSAAQNFVVLSKDNMHLTASSSFKGLFYSDEEAHVYSHDTLTGAITAKKIIVNHDTNIFYDEGLISNYCLEIAPLPEVTLPPLNFGTHGRFNIREIKTLN